VPWVGRALRIWLTGYSFQDNTPPGSAVVSHSILHRKAGGAGTYNDPITVASPGSAQDMAFPPGTKFYLPSVLRYVMVEDSGASPAPAGLRGIWTCGSTDRVTAKHASDTCMDLLTTKPITANGTCHIPRAQTRDGYGDDQTTPR